MPRLIWNESKTAYQYGFHLRRWGALYPPLQTAHARRFVLPASTDWISLCISGFAVPALVTDSSEFESVRSWAWAISTSSKETTPPLHGAIGSTPSIRRWVSVVVPYFKWHIIKARPPRWIGADNIIGTSTAKKHTAWHWSNIQAPINHLSAPPFQLPKII